MTIKNGETDINVSGALSQGLDLKAGELWRVSLRLLRTDGDVTITAEIDVTTDNKDADFDLEVPIPLYEFDTVFEAVYHGDKYATGGGYFNLSFMNIISGDDLLFEAFSIEGFMTLAGDTGNITLPAGDYRYEFNENYTGAPFTFLSYHEIGNQGAGTYYTARLSDTEPQSHLMVTSGVLTVAVEGKVYTVEGTFKDQDGKRFKCKFTGEIEFRDVNAPEQYTATLMQASSAVNQGEQFGKGVGSIIVLFEGMEIKGQEQIMTQWGVNFYGPLLGNEIAAGTYNANVGQADNFSFQRGYWLPPFDPTPTYFMQMSNVTGQAIILIDQAGAIEVARNGANYEITSEMTGTNVATGKRATVKCSYTGPINIQ